MKTQVITGRFLNRDGEPMEGNIEFIPAESWYEEDGITYAHLGCTVELEDGYFTAEVDCAEYDILCPIGKWRVLVKHRDRVSYLSDYLPSRFQ